jgi:NTE family protein
MILAHTRQNGQSNRRLSIAYPATDTIPVDIALQGGGAHGGFTWGVLDRLPEAQQLRLAGISDTSAGAMNAVVLAHCHALGGADGAKAALEDLWQLKML